MINIISAKTYISEEHFDCDITPRRHVEYYEIELYNRGSGITCIDGLRLAHKKNRFICAKPGQIRFSHGSFACESIHFTCTDFSTRKLINSLPDYADADDETALEIREILTDLYRNYTDPLLANSAVFSLLSSIFSDRSYAAVPPAPEKYYSNIMAAKDFIDSNYAEQINIDDIAADTYLSPNFLRAEFKNFIGITPHEYLAEMRIANACKLLKSTDRPLAEIAFECGFKSQSYMNYVFKKKFKKTPKMYREE
mgnify:CR=1 FL=1